MRLQKVLIVAIVLVVASPASAKLVEFNQGHHEGDGKFTGMMASMILETNGLDSPFNTIRFEADEATVRSATTDYYIDMESGPSHAWEPTHEETTLHNVVVEAIARDTTLYVAFHPIESATISYQSETAASGPTKDESYSDVNWIQMAEPRTSDVSETLDVASKGHVDAEINGGVSVNLWGWNVRITSDEGAFEYQTGPSRDTQVGSMSAGPATQLQVESVNATVTVAGTFDGVHQVWIKDAVAVSDRLDLKLTDEDLPTDQEVFTERSRLTVLGVTDTVTANVTQVLAPESVTPQTAPKSDPSPTFAEEILDDQAAGQSPQTATTEDVPRTWLGWTFAAFALAAALVVAAWIALRLASWWLVRTASSLDPSKTVDARRIHSKCTAALRSWPRNGPAYALRARAALTLRKPSSALLDQEQAHRFLRPVIDHEALLRNARDAAVNAVRLDRNESAVAWMHRVKALQDA